MTHHNGAFFWLSLSFLLLFSSSSLAQSFFQLDEKDNQLHFSYHWDDFDGNQNAIEFSAHKKDFLEPLKRYRGFNRERSQRELSRQLNRYIRQQNWRGIQAKLTPRQQSVELVTSRARNQEQQTQLEQYKRRCASTTMSVGLTIWILISTKVSHCHLESEVSFQTMPL